MLELQSTLMPWTPLSLADMERATLALLEESNNKFGSERSTYVGASEVGDCAHRVAHRKVFPELHAITDPSSAGRMLRGTALENTLVQIVRLSPLGKWIRDTGANQIELVVPDAPIRVHPDGTILRLPVPDGQTHALVLDPSGQLIEIEISSLAGPGVLELKTLGLGAFTSMKKKGLSSGYIDQTQTQMGATSRKWALLVGGMADDPSRALIFLIRFDQSRWDFLKEKARAIIAAVEKTIVSEDLADLPAPDKTCGHCDYCPLQGECPAFAVMDADPTAVFPEDAALEVEVLAQEYLECNSYAARLKVIKEQLKDVFAAYPVEMHLTADGIKANRRFSGETTQCHFDVLKAKYPAAFADASIVYTTPPSLWVAVSVPKMSSPKKGKK